MIKFEYKPWEPERTWGYAEDVPPVEELTMTLGDGVSWEEATDEFHNFLRGAGYVIPYYNVNEADEDDYVEEVDRLRAKKKQIYEDLKSEQTHNTKGEVTYDPETGEPLIDGYPLYSGLPNREWVGLTDDDINEAVQFPWHFIPFARAIEAKLKEKNT